MRPAFGNRTLRTVWLTPVLAACLPLFAQEAAEGPAERPEPVQPMAYEFHDDFEGTALDDLWYGISIAYTPGEWVLSGYVHFILRQPEPDQRKEGEIYVFYEEMVLLLHDKEVYSGKVQGGTDENYYLQWAQLRWVQHDPTTGAMQEPQDVFIRFDENGYRWESSVGVGQVPIPVECLFDPMLGRYAALREDEFVPGAAVEVDLLASKTDRPVDMDVRIRVGEPADIPDWKDKSKKLSALPLTHAATSGLSAGAQITAWMDLSGSGAIVRYEVEAPVPEGGRGAAGRKKIGFLIERTDHTVKEKLKWVFTPRARRDPFIQPLTPIGLISVEDLIVDGGAGGEEPDMTQQVYDEFIRRLQALLKEAKQLGEHEEVAERRNEIWVEAAEIEEGIRKGRKQEADVKTAKGIVEAIRAVFGNQDEQVVKGLEHTVRTLRYKLAVFHPSDAKALEEMEAQVKSAEKSYETVDWTVSPHGPKAKALLEEARELVERARKRHKFWQNAPKVNGFMIKTVPKESEVSVGLDLLGQRVDLQTTIYVFVNIGLITIVDGGHYFEGEKLDELTTLVRVGPAGELTFEYAGERIIIPYQELR